MLALSLFVLCTSVSFHNAYVRALRTRDNPTENDDDRVTNYEAAISRDGLGPRLKRRRRPASSNDGNAPLPPPAALPPPLWGGELRAGGPYVIPYHYYAQGEEWQSGVYAIKIALSTRAMHKDPNITELIQETKTTERDGTALLAAIKTLNDRSRNNYYDALYVPAKPTLRDLEVFRADLLESVSMWYPPVLRVNTSNGHIPPFYPNGTDFIHYIAIVGYHPEDKMMLVADPANYSGASTYWYKPEDLIWMVAGSGFAG